MDRWLAVALRKESVDRKVNLRVVDGSRSSVALRKESVDRKHAAIIGGLHDPQLSLSARRAWIENSGGAFARPLAACRSPQGERG